MPFDLLECYNWSKYGTLVPIAISLLGGTWWWSIHCQLYLWFSSSYQHGTRTIRKRDCMPKTYHMFGIRCSSYKCVFHPSRNRRNDAYCASLVKISHPFLRTVHAHSRTTTEWRRNVNFILTATVVSLYTSNLATPTSTKGKGLVNSACELHPTGMQLARWCNQTCVLLKYMMYMYKVCMLPKKCSQSVLQLQYERCPGSLKQ